MTCRRSLSWWLAGLACGGLVVAAGVASAGVSKVLGVPWQGDPGKPHTAISGEPVELCAVIYGDAAGGAVAYTWDFKDGSAPASGTFTVPANGIFNLKLAHTFTGSTGAVFNTALTVNGVPDTYRIMIGPTNDDSRVNIAIDKGLWWSHVQMTRTTGGTPPVPIGYWGVSNGSGTFYVGPTGANVWAFEVQGHKLSVEANPLNPLEDPYVEDVQRGINYLLTRTFNQAMSLQSGASPDTNGNGYGLVCYYESGHTNYEQGLAMGAISGSGAPNATAATGVATYVLGRKYSDIVQDMVDWYAWSQIDGTSYPTGGATGGWYYTAFNNAGGAGTYGDNSASQWAYIGLEAARANFGSTIPAWTLERLARYLHLQLSYGSRGWVSYRADYTTYPSVVLTGGALVGMALVGEATFDAQNGAGAFASDMALAKTFLGTNWRGQADRWTENWYGHQAYYTMYACMKGFRMNGIEALPGSPGTANWYNDYVGVMLRGTQKQATDGSWTGAGWMDSYIRSVMGTPFGVLILTPSVFSTPPEACFTAKPNPGYLDIDIAFDPSCSKHVDPTKKIVKYEWDWNSDGTYDESTTSPTVVLHGWPSADFSLGTYNVTLRVTDDTAPVPVTDTATIAVDLTNPPHPPVSVPGGPYLASSCSLDSVLLNGASSFDIDAGQSESGNPPYDGITAYDWDLDGSPWTYATVSGAQVLQPASYFPGPSVYDIGLRVTDNTAAAYPNSGKPNLTDEAFTTVEIRAGVICNLSARPKSGKVQLTWTNIPGGTGFYDVYRSTAGPNSGFARIAANWYTTYSTYLDGTVTNGKTYYYRVAPAGSTTAISNAASATPVALVR